MKLSENSNYELRSYIYKVISQLVCEIITFENVMRGFRSRNASRNVLIIYISLAFEDTTVSMWALKCKDIKYYLASDWSNHFWRGHGSNHMATLCIRSIANR